MENLGTEDFQQLLNYYRQKCSDLELQLLQMQIKLSKIVIKTTEPVPAIKTTINKSNKTKE